MINIKKILIAVMTMIALLVVPQAAYAETATDTATGTSDTTTTTTTTTAPTADEGNCGKTKTQLISCDKGTTTGISAISALIKIAIVVMTVLIGVVATGGIAFAAILYASARDNQSQLDQSKTIIRNVVIGIFLYGFTIAIINWLIPGGVIG